MLTAKSKYLKRTVTRLISFFSVTILAFTFTATFLMTNLIPVTESGLSISHSLESKGEKKSDKVLKLRKEAKKLFKKKKWQKASKSLTKLKKMVQGHEKAMVEKMLFRTMGEIAWGKLKKSIKEKHKPHVVVAKVGKFIKKYKESRPLLKKAEVYQQSWLDKIYTTIEDFEDDRELDYDIQLISNPKLVKQGKRAGRWHTEKFKQYHILIKCPRDWSAHHTLVLWIHSKKKGGRLTFDVLSDKENYFEAWNVIDWVGWKELKIPFQGKKARFRKEGRPKWTRIDSLRIWKDEGKGIDIIIDDIRLGKN